MIFVADEKKVKTIFFLDDGKSLYKIGEEESPIGSIRLAQQGERSIPEEDQPVVFPHVEVHIILSGKIKFVPAK